MKIRIIPFLIAAACTAVLPPVAHAQAAACDKAQSARAEKEIDAVFNFTQLHKAWQDWKHCDSGPVADLYTDAVFRLLVDWKGVEELAGTLRSSPEYRAWLLARVKAGTEDDRGAIYSRAKTGCPSGQDALCTELIKASEGDMKPMPSLAPAPALAPLPAPAPASGGGKK